MAADVQDIRVNVLENIKKVLLSWPGVTSQPHRFGGVEFGVGRKEMGHVHGSVLADFPFPMSVRNQLIKEGKVVPHNIVPNSGWVSFWISGEGDSDALIRLFQMQYERLGATLPK